MQRPLWASTSTKNPEYKDTIYVDKLIGPETVNTMPLSTLKATMDHAEVRPTLEEGIDEARKLFEELRWIILLTHLLRDGFITLFASD